MTGYVIDNDGKGRPLYSYVDSDLRRHFWTISDRGTPLHFDDDHIERLKREGRVHLYRTPLPKAAA